MHSPALSPSSRVCTSVTNHRPCSPFVIHILPPLRTHSDPFGRARVELDAGSEPASASEIANEPSWSAACIVGTISALTRSEPNRQSISATML
jgi:hypothetical protein